MRNNSAIRQFGNSAIHNLNFVLLMTAFLLFGNQKLRAQTLPYSNSFEAADTSFHLNILNDSLSWKLANGGLSSSRCLLSEYVTNSSGNNGDRYFASKRLNLVAGNTYRVSFQSKVQYSNKRKIKLALNTTSSRAGSSLLHDFGTIAASENYQSYSTNFSVDSSGQYFLIYYGENIANHPECLWYTDDFSVTVINTPPSVTLVEPTDNSWFNPDQSVGFAATVSDGENNVAKVEFYEGANKVAEDFTPNGFGIYTASNLPANGGTQTLTAKAIDSLGASATSNSRTINVRYLPQASITNLTPYSKYFPGLQRVTATATDPDGTVQYVVFYLDEDSIGTDSTAPYEMHVPLVFDANMLGHYVYARAVDNDGLVGSDAVRINVVPGICSLITPNSTLHQTLCWGDSIALSSEGEDGTTGFQWMFKANPEDTWTTISSTKPKLYAHQAGLYAIAWTYENNAVCTTAVDTVAIFKVEVPTVYVYGDQPALATAHTYGGAEPYTFIWSSYDSCLNATCDSVMISDFSGPVVVTVEDGLGCLVIDSVNFVREFCNSNLDQDSIIHYLGDSIEVILTKQELNFQDFITHEKASIENGTFKAAEGLESDFLVVPVVFFIANNPNPIPDKKYHKWDPVHPSTGPVIEVTRTIPANAIKNLIINNPNILQSQLDAVNAILNDNPISVGSRTKRIKLCMAKKKPNGGDINILDFIHDAPGPIAPGGAGSALLTSFYQQHPEINDKYLRIFLGNTGGDSWGYQASNIYYGGAGTRDGIGIDIDMLGPVAPNQYADFPSSTKNETGTVLCHEIGHFFDLRHTFEPFGTSCGSNGNNNCIAYNSEITNIFYGSGGCPMWDFVKDTPPQSKAYYKSLTCGNQPYGYSICLSHQYGPNDTNILLSNVMNYQPNICVGSTAPAFTPGQLERMYYAIQYYRPTIVSPANLVTTGVDCGMPLAQFTYSKNSVCGSGDNAKIVFKPLDNQNPNYSYDWTVTGGSAVISPDDGSASETTITFDTESEGEATITLKVSDGGTPPVEQETSLKVYISELCGGHNTGKNNIFFGNYGGLSWSLTQPPLPNLGAFNATSNRIHAKGGTVTYNDPISGNLVFYASGNSFWNSNHQKLSSVTLQTDEGTSQYGIAMPSPENPEKVWLFTVPKYDNTNSSTNFNASGLRLHKIDPLNINNSQWNQTIPPVSGTSSSTAGSSAKVSEKIAAIPKGSCSKDGYWLISQGAKGSDTETKLLVHEINSTGVSVPQVYSTPFASQTGFIKPSPLGDRIIVTFSDLNMNDGTGQGKNAWLYSFNRTTGVVDVSNGIELKIPNLPTGVAQSSTYGGAFSPNGKQVFVNVNSPFHRNATTGEITHFAGIYQFEIPNTTVTNITGTKLSGIPYSISPSLDLMLAGDDKIYISNSVSPILTEWLRQFNLTLNFLPQSSKYLGVIHFPNQSTNVGITWEGPSLVTNASQDIFSSGGLSNFMETPVEVIIPQVGLTAADPLDLGTNPGIGCCHVYSEVNVACTGNDEAVSTTGNDYYYKFKVQRASTSDPFLELRVSSVMCDFGTNTKLEYIDGNGNPQVIGGTAQGNGKWWIIDGTAIGNFIINSLLVEFRLTVDAVSPAASGFFKVVVNYHDPEDTQPSCCRMAVNGPPDPVFSMPSPKPAYAKMANNINIYPNPSSGIFTIDGLSGQNSTIELSDLAGRSFPANLLEENRLDVRHLAKGVYHLKILDNDRIYNQKIIIQ